MALKESKELKRYKALYKELQIECNNLKKLIETVDPMDIDFKTKINTIDNLKFKIDCCHLSVLDDIE